MAGNGDKRPGGERPLGFWACWSLTVGVMIGSGVFMLPAVLAPYGGLSFFGWLITGGGSILLALTLGRLAGRTTKTGGPYAYAHEAFGSLTGFLVAWGYWISVVAATTAIAVAFAGYLTVFIPVLGENPVWQFIAAAVLIWLIAGINIAGVGIAGRAQLVMTLLKLIPLLLIIALGFALGDAANLPAFNPSGEGILPALAATALLTMWAFAGLEAGTIPAGDVRDAKRTIPLAVVAGTVTVTLVYILSTAAVMLLVPADQLALSTSPFADAARALGAWGPPLIAAGALVATAGALNGNILVSGQMPMTAAIDRLAPAFLARRNKGGAPQAALMISSGLSTLLLVLNYAGGLVAAFTFLISMSTLALLAPLAVSALADIRHSWRTARPYVLIGALALAYTAFAILGSGVVVILWGLVLFAAGLPLYWVMKRTTERSDA